MWFTYTLVFVCVCLCVCVCVCVRACLCTWPGPLRYCPIPDLMSKLRPVVILVDHVDDNVNGVLNLVTVNVHCMCS